MDDMDFTKPQAAHAPTPSAPFKAAASPCYNAAVAERIFRAAGKSERFSAGQVLFAEDDKAKGGLFSMRSASRMYFLCEGEVALAHGGRLLDTLKAGEVLGEMAVVSERPRSATATAKSDCLAISLDRTGLQAALAQAPEFALMLMSVMFDRLRFIAARLAARKTAANLPAHESTVFEPALLAQFEAALPRASTVRHWASTEIMREGQKGAFMYVVKSGRVAISIRGNTVEAVNPGGTFGEMALVDQSPRTATAIAETECELLQFDRSALLEAVKAQPAFAMAMLRAVTERLRYMNAQLG
jgi:CRP-like cAMP-binding protein